MQMMSTGGNDSGMKAKHSETMLIAVSINLPGHVCGVAAGPGGEVDKVGGRDFIYFFFVIFKLHYLLF